MDTTPITLNADTLWGIVDNIAKYAKGTRMIAKGKEQQRIIAALGSQLATVLYDPLNAINTPQRIAFFLGQCAQESDQFCAVTEYADGSAYNGRRDLGNHLGLNFGIKYKGRGPIQITGYYNYLVVHDTLGVDCINHPEILADDPVIGLRAAGLFWSHPHFGKFLNPFADKDDIDMVTHRVNGGYYGLKGRIIYTDRAKRLVGLPVHPYTLGRDAAVALRVQNAQRF